MDCNREPLSQSVSIVIAEKTNGVVPFVNNNMAELYVWIHMDMYEWNTGRC